MVIGLLLTAMVMQCACSAVPEAAELDEAAQWVAAKFVGAPAETRPAETCVHVITNYDPVQQNARAGASMRMAGQAYSRGLYCHAPSKLVVQLEAPATCFEAIVGVDSNNQTSGGRGSVVFSVRAGERALWQSEVLREGMAVVPLSVDLEGAQEFTLEIGNGGDGISCDQADWAEAKVTLQDGTEVWLGDVPLREGYRVPYGSGPFFSFQYGGRASSEFLADWPVERSRREMDGQRTEHTITYTDPETGLVVRCVGVAYRDFPTVEWTLFFKNTGSEDTPILSAIQAMDAGLPQANGGNVVLHHHKGDNCVADSYAPLTDPLPPGADLRIANTGGRPTQTAFPYFNLDWGGEGAIMAVSWAGQWAAQFTHSEAGGLRVAAGQERTHFTLHPGEEVRTPMMVLQFWRGDRLHAQNVWRSWMVAHNLPRPGGKLPPVPQLAACSSHQFGEMINANTENQIFFVDRYLERGINLDYWWMDAGWYVNKTGWPNVGTWEVDTARFPGGLRVIADHVHAKGLKTLLWFEPERVTGGTWLAEEHPEWVHGGKKGGLLDLGNPEARNWLIEHVDGLLTSQGIDLYRQDFNMDPLGFWRDNDAEDRQGITEIRHVEGYFAYWDELRRRHPDMLIDSCASGGWRNDLETLRRAVPLLRSDYIMEPVGNQCHTHQLSLWFPFSGTGTSKTDPYLVWSVLCPHFIACWDQRQDDIDHAALKGIIDQWRVVGPHYLSDYYPLTPYTLGNDQWIAWQFGSAEGGMVQAFRRGESVYETARLPLHGLDPEGRYRVRDIAGQDAEYVCTGQELLAEGVRVFIGQRPGVALLAYERE